MRCSVCAVAPRPPEWKCVPLRGRPRRGRGSGNRACSQHQREQAARNTTRQHVFVSRTCVGVGVELSNVKRRKTLYIRTTRTDSHVGRRPAASGTRMSVDYRAGYGPRPDKGATDNHYHTIPARRITSTFTTRTGNTHDVVIGTMTRTTECEPQNEKFLNFHSRTRGNSPKVCIWRER